MAPAAEASPTVVGAAEVVAGMVAMAARRHLIMPVLAGAATGRL